MGSRLEDVHPRISNSMDILVRMAPTARYVVLHSSAIYGANERDRAHTAEAILNDLANKGYELEFVEDELWIFKASEPATP